MASSVGDWNAEMAIARPGQLNVEEPTPIGGSRSVDCFEKLELIGEGSFGLVYMARENRTKEIVALKKIRMDDLNYQQGFPITAIREIKILNKLRHDNIIRLKEVVTSSGPDKDNQEEKTDKNRYKRETYLVFEYMDHDLSGLFYCPGVQFTEPQIKCYMKQLLIGLQYCHANQVLHRDIKCANLLINNEGKLKLGDFGLAICFNTDVPNAYSVISLWYRPPELLLGARRYGTAVDMWSVGCVFAELLYGEAIFPGNTEVEQLHMIYQLLGTPDENDWPEFTKLPLYDQYKPKGVPMKSRLREKFRNFDPHALKLVERMLEYNPTKRITLLDALNDAYFSTEPLPCDPKSLPTYESALDLKTKNTRKRMREEEEEAAAAAKAQKSAPTNVN